MIQIFNNKTEPICRRIKTGTINEYMQHKKLEILQKTLEKLKNQWPTTRKRNDDKYWMEMEIKVYYRARVVQQPIAQKHGDDDMLK